MMQKPEPDTAPYQVKERFPAERDHRPVFDIVNRFGVVIVAAVICRDWAEGVASSWNAA